MFFAVLYGCQKQDEKPISVSISNADVVIPKTYIAPKIIEQIVVDGKPEKIWNQADFTSSFVDIEGNKKPKPLYDTKLKMLWDDKFLYVYVKMDEPHIWGDIKRRDEVIFYNNDFEVFLNPSNDTYMYGEIEINALNTVWDLLLNQPYSRGGKPNNRWDLLEMKTAVHMEGTLNNPSDLDNYWAVEMAIPLEGLRELKNAPQTFPKVGDIWRINFSRVEWQHELKDNIYHRKKDNGKYLPEYNWVWSPQGVVNMHYPEMWGYLQFSKTKNEKPVVSDDDKVIKQVVYILYKKIWEGDLVKLKSKKIGTTIKINSFKVKNITFEGVFNRTQVGFELLVKVNREGLTFVVDNYGYVREIKH